MGLFKRKPRETNEKDNFALKEALAEEAIEKYLVMGKDYKSLSELRAEFGYVFIIEDHGFEALFKILSPRETFYFAAQGDRIAALDFDEQLFKSTTDAFLSLHG